MHVPADEAGAAREALAYLSLPHAPLTWILVNDNAQWVRLGNGFQFDDFNLIVVVNPSNKPLRQKALVNLHRQDPHITHLPFPTSL